MKTVLITGASSGIGLETAKQLSNQGYKVFGTSRNPKPNQDLPFTMLSLDVNDDVSAKNCLEQIGHTCLVCHKAMLFLRNQIVFVQVLDYVVLNE